MCNLVGKGVDGLNKNASSAVKADLLGELLVDNIDGSFFSLSSIADTDAAPLFLFLPSVDVVAAAAADPVLRDNPISRGKDIAGLTSIIRRMFVGCVGGPRFNVVQFALLLKSLQIILLYQ